VRWLTRLLLKFIDLAGGAASRAATAAYWPSAYEKDAYVNWSARVKYPERITFGVGLRVGSDCVLGAAGGIRFGDHVRISRGAILETGGLDFSGPAPYPHVCAPISVGNGVWIGSNAIILAGVTIGDSSIIGAGAVVTRDLPPNTIYVGAKGRVLAKKLAE
jgi:maltose O-acetyltransferase